MVADPTRADQRSLQEESTVQPHTAFEPNATPYAPVQGVDHSHHKPRSISTCCSGPMTREAVLDSSSWQNCNFKVSLPLPEQ